MYGICDQFGERYCRKSHASGLRRCLYRLYFPSPRVSLPGWAGLRPRKKRTVSRLSSPRMLTPTGKCHKALAASPVGFSGTIRYQSGCPPTPPKKQDGLSKRRRRSRRSGQVPCRARQLIPRDHATWLPQPEGVHERTDKPP